MKNSLILLLLSISAYTHAQIYPFQHPTERDNDRSDTTTLQYFLSNGSFYGHARYYFMATDNENQLTDFYANAFGMGIGYESAKFKGFQIGMSGFFIYNLHSSDLTKPDPTTGQSSRYEIGQFDMLNPNNRHDMDRLEDLYLKYTYLNSTLKFGKQHIRTPFINPQDGRMRPTLVEGALLELNEFKNTKIEAGWLFGISPRGTVSWFGVGESIGVFPTGVNLDGTKSGYAGRIQSNAVYFAGLTRTFGTGFKLQLWNQHIDNVLNSSLAQLNHDIKVGQNHKLVYGLQYIEQHAVNKGGNNNQQQTYVPANHTSRTFGARLGFVKNNHWQVQANYNRITKDGRYLMPREWGRDPFFTFMSRERNEGFGDVHAMNIVLGKTFGKSGWKMESAYGQYYLPDIKNTSMNKYAMPSYFQANIDIRYTFSKFFKGLETQFLYVYKGNLGNTYDNDKNVINKVNMSLYNLVLNYHF